MIGARAQPGGTARSLTCAQCGAVFACDLSSECWCMAEPFRLPLPETAAQDCLCPACLRRQAAAQGAVASGR